MQVTAVRPHPLLQILDGSICTPVIQNPHREGNIAQLSFDLVEQGANIGDLIQDWKNNEDT